MSRLDEIIQTVTANEMREITVERAKQIAIEYAEECVKASLEKASENGKVTHVNYGVIGEFIVVKESITNPENIILL